jgi:hypothetical protein
MVGPSDTLTAPPPLLGVDVHGAERRDVAQRRVSTDELTGECLELYRARHRRGDPQDQ